MISLRLKSDQSACNIFFPFFSGPRKMDPSPLEALYQDFLDVNSKNFASVNVDQIYRNSLNDAQRHPVSRNAIEKLKSSLESISREKERRVLKGRKRKASFRKWLTFAPRHIILGRTRALRFLIVPT